MLVILSCYLSHAISTSGHTAASYTVSTLMYFWYYILFPSLMSLILFIFLFLWLEVLHGLMLAFVKLIKLKDASPCGMRTYKSPFRGIDRWIQSYVKIFIHNTRPPWQYVSPFSQTRQPSCRLGVTQQLTGEIALANSVTVLHYKSRVTAPSTPYNGGRVVWWVA